MANLVVMPKTYTPHVDIVKAVDLNANFALCSNRIYVCTEATLPAVPDYAGQVFMVTDADPAIQCRVWFADSWYAIPLAIIG